MGDSKEKLEEIKKAMKEFSTQAPEVSKFLEYVEAAEKPKTLDTKTKEIISLSIAVVVKCEPCILWHTKAALDAGATEEEITDALKIAVVMGGGPALMYAAKAYEILKEFKV
jgi:AhpD family alkylhydroperoxidase